MHLSSLQETIAVFDQACLDQDTDRLHTLIDGGAESHMAVRMQQRISQKGWEIYHRKNNRLIRIDSDQGLFGTTLNVTRSAKMPDGSKCRETFSMVRRGGEWRIAEKRSIEIKKNHPTWGVMEYNGYHWSLLHHVPWLNELVRFDMEADEVADELGPTQNQLKTVDRILNYPHNVVDQIAEKTYRFVRETLENWLGDWDGLDDEELREYMGFTFSKPANASDALHTILPPYFRLL